MIEEYMAFTKANGYFDRKRNEQAKYWMYESIHDMLNDAFYHHPRIEERLPVIEKQVSSFVAAREMMDLFLKK